MLFSGCINLSYGVIVTWMETMKVNLQQSQSSFCIFIFLFIPLSMESVLDKYYIGIYSPSSFRAPHNVTPI